MPTRITFFLAMLPQRCIASPTTTTTSHNRAIRGKMTHLPFILIALGVIHVSLGLETYTTGGERVELDKSGGVRRLSLEAVFPTTTPTLEPTHPEPTHEPTHESPTHEPTHPPMTSATHVEPTTDGGCKLQVPKETTEECKKKPASNQDLPLCVGIRGNGPYLWAHFPALARTVEAFGPISGVAGGSSATVTSFLLESMTSNPLILECSKDICCSEMEQRARISFLLKTVEQVPSGTLIDPSEILASIMLQIAQEEILKRLQSDEPEVQDGALQDLLAIFARDDIAPLVNPDLIDLLQTSPDPVFHAVDILSATSSGSFTVNNDVLVFIRPYILNFLALAQIVDIVAAFYSGLEPVDLKKMNVMLTDCAMPSFGLDWKDTQSIHASSGQTCGKLFMLLYQEFILSRTSSHPTRLDDNLGDSLNTLITIAVLRDEAAKTWGKAVEDYENAKVPVSFDINFSNIKFGYYGNEGTLDRVSERLRALFNDTKSEKLLALGPATWRDALLQSTAEPTLSRGVPIFGEEMVSVAGWPDPTPSQVLTSMGCDRVVLINRPRGQGRFAVDIATLLGASHETLDALNSLDNKNSAFITAIHEADATYCVDWESQPQLAVAGIANEGYEAPLLSDDACILSLDVGATHEDIPGCTA